MSTQKRKRKLLYEKSLDEQKIDNEIIVYVRYMEALESNAKHDESQPGNRATCNIFRANKRQSSFPSHSRTNIETKREIYYIY